MASATGRSLFRLSEFPGLELNISYIRLTINRDNSTAKSLLQTDPRFRNWSLINVLKTVYSEQGVRGLYHGLTVTCFRAAPAHALIFFSFEWIDRALLHL